MNIHHKITKEQERETMLEMLEQREGRLSSVPNTCWAREFWSLRAGDRSEIKRMLGMRLTNMPDHIRTDKSI